MSYNLVEIETHVNALEAQFNAAKLKGQYAGNEQHWDGEMIKILNKDCSQAEHNVKTNAEFIESQRLAAQGIVKDATRVLSQKVLTETDFQLIEQAPAAISKCIDRIDADMQELAHANVQYRGGWPATAAEVLSPGSQNILGPLRATRQHGIDNSRELANKKQRVQEYLVRSHEFFKQAKQRQNKGAVEVTEFNKDCDNIKTKMEAGKAEIEDAHYKKTQTIKSISDLEKVKVWPEDKKKLAPGWMKLIAADAKLARGKLKTLKVLIEGLEKRGKAAGPGWKDAAADAVKQAVKPYQEAIKASKKFDEDEEACRKICKLHGITV